MDKRIAIFFIVDRIGVAETAKRLHVGKSVVYYWLSGDRNPGYHVGKEIERLYKRLAKQKGDR